MEETGKYCDKAQTSKPHRPQKVWFRVDETLVFKKRLVKENSRNLLQNDPKINSNRSPGTLEETKKQFQSDSKEDI